MVVLASGDYAEVLAIPESPDGGFAIATNRGHYHCKRTASGEWKTEYAGRAAIRLSNPASSLSIAAAAIELLISAAYINANSDLPAKNQQKFKLHLSRAIVIYFGIAGEVFINQIEKTVTAPAFFAH